MEAGHKLADKFLEAKKRKDYTAIMAVNDLIAYGIIQRLQEKGLGIPDDLPSYHLIISLIPDSLTRLLPPWTCLPDYWGSGPVI